MKSGKYYIQLEGESCREAADGHVEFYDTITEAVDDANAQGDTLSGINFKVRRLSDDVIVKRGTIKCLN